MPKPYFATARLKRFKKLISNGDLAGLKMMLFGKTIYELRHLKKLSQERAAELAEITRVQWNRIENGRMRPLPTTIPGLAKALVIYDGILFQLADYAVPEKFIIYDKKKAHQRLDDAIACSLTRDEFMLYLGLIWEEYQMDLMSSCIGGIPKMFRINLDHSEMLAKILEHLTGIEKLQLARELVQSANHKDAEAIQFDFSSFYEMINNKLEEYRLSYWYKEVFLPNKEFII